jgi:signal transduction histidine kinase
MLAEFIASNRDAVIDHARARVAHRAAPRPTPEEMDHGIPLFVDMLVLAMRARTDSAGMASSATTHGASMLGHGFTIAQVVYDFGDVCQAIMEVATHKEASVSPAEFQQLNACLDEAIAQSVTEYTRMRDKSVKHDETERLGFLAHELRNKMNTAMLAFGILKEGKVGLTGSTGAVLDRSLAGLQDLITRSLSEVRVEAGLQHRERLTVRDLIEDVEAEAVMPANAKRVHLTVTPVPKDLEVDADRPLLVGALINLLSNAVKFTPSGGQTWLRTTEDGAHIVFEVEDQCGGLPGGSHEELFAPWHQRGTDKGGLGLGLPLVRRTVQALGGEVTVRNKPGVGCVFGIRLLRAVAVPEKPRERRGG